MCIICTWNLHDYIWIDFAICRQYTSKIPILLTGNNWNLPTDLNLAVLDLTIEADDTWVTWLLNSFRLDSSYSNHKEKITWSDHSRYWPKNHVPHPQTLNVTRKYWLFTHYPVYLFMNVKCLIKFFLAEIPHLFQQDMKKYIWNLMSYSSAYLKVFVIHILFSRVWQWPSKYDNLYLQFNPRINVH